MELEKALGQTQARKGRSVGSEAHKMPMFSSIADQFTDAGLSHVMSDDTDMR